MNKNVELLKKIEDAGNLVARELNVEFDGVTSDSFSHIAMFSRDGEIVFHVGYSFFMELDLTFFQVYSKMVKEFCDVLPQDKIN